MFNKEISTILIAFLLSVSTVFSANAAENLVEQWYMQPRLNIQTEPDPNSLLRYQRLKIGQALHKRINLEISLLSDKPVVRSSDNRGIVIDGRYYLNQTGQFTPYIAGGVSRLKNSQLNTQYQEPTTNIGLGFEHTLKGNGTKIQADIRYFLDDRQSNVLDNKNANDWTLSFGVSIPITMDLFK